ncbi:MAG: hypothetical protein M0006_05595 [Magnetospirillum sp.]|nr:hypothetical protein [Magnetospirillum sp.]
MSTINPSLPSFQLGPTQPVGQILATPAGPVPPQIAALPSGTVLQAAMLPQQGAGSLIQVATEAGAMTLRVRGDPLLPEGAALGLQVVQTGSQLGLRLVSVNGQPLGPPSGSAAQAALPPPPLSLPQAMPAVSATGGEQGAPTLAGQPAALPPTAPQPPPSQPALTATVLRPAESGAAAPPPGIPPNLVPGNQLGVRIAQATPPGIAPPSPSPAPSGGGSSAAIPVLTGTVIDNTPSGQAVVQTSAGTLAMPTAQNLPPGTALTLEIVTLPAATPNAAPPPPTSGAPGANGWPALGEAVRTLAQNESPAELRQILGTLPQLDARLATNLSLFANALSSGDASLAIGKAMTRALDRAGRRDLAARLQADVGTLGADSAKPLGDGDWSGFTLPLLVGLAVEPVRLYVRRPHADGEEAAAGNGRNNDHRFLVEITLSRLGRMQFDGLVQRPTKRFDLIIRTGQPLSADVRRDILGIFADVGAATGTQGSVTFQAGGRFVELPPSTFGETRLTV